MTIGLRPSVELDCRSMKMDQIMDGFVDIVSIDGGARDVDPTDDATRKFWRGELVHFSVADMVTKILQRLGWGWQIQTLTIIGHGNEGRMNVGCVSTPDWSGEKMLYVDYHLADDELRLFGPAEVQMNHVAHARQAFLWTTEARSLRHIFTRG
jgi:hypothetical protein